MAINPKCPALIDPPFIEAPVGEWEEFLADLLRSDTPGLEPFVDEAREIIRMCGVTNPPHNG